MKTNTLTKNQTLFLMPENGCFAWVLNSDIMKSENYQKNVSKGTILHCKEVKQESIENDKYYILQYEIEGNKCEIIRQINIIDDKYLLTCHNPQNEDDNFVLSSEEMKIFAKISLVIYKEVSI